MIIVGVSAYYHDSACCLLRDGRLIAAVAEERLSRVKHDARLPGLALRFCLDAASCGIGDIDAVGYYESPRRKLSRQLSCGADLGLDPQRPERELREILGIEAPIMFFPHHSSHAASAYYASGYEDAAILTTDGVGEWATMTYGSGSHRGIDIFDEVHFPHSLGLFYSTITAYLGFEVNEGEYKVMGLAAYGRPRFADKIRRVIRNGPQGAFELTPEYFDFPMGVRMFSDLLCNLFGRGARTPGDEVDQFHADVAASVQLSLEEILLQKCDYLAKRTRATDLCMAGGVALNCVANGRIAREGPFRRVFVQPAAGDDGAALGAACLAHVALANRPPAIGPLEHAFWGPEYSNREVGELLHTLGIAAVDFEGRERLLFELAAARLSEGWFLGWFHGRSEFGPRALGARSILADPRGEGTRDGLNHRVKQREPFRPFAPSVMAEHYSDVFDIDHVSPFMMETCKVRHSWTLPAVTHIDGTARVQTVDNRTSPRYAALLAAFKELTGCPVLLNTSFNMRGEPIVCTPVDAIVCAINADLDALVLEDFFIERAALTTSLRAALEIKSSQCNKTRAVSQIYTFV